VRRSSDAIATQVVFDDFDGLWIRQRWTRHSDAQDANR
jgi:hypothetical protein